MDEEALRHRMDSLWLNCGGHFYFIFWLLLDLQWSSCTPVEKLDFSEIVLFVFLIKFCPAKLLRRLWLSHLTPVKRNTQNCWNYLNITFIFAKTCHGNAVIDSFKVNQASITADDWHEFRCGGERGAGRGCGRVSTSSYCKLKLKYPLPPCSKWACCNSQAWAYRWRIETT